MILDNVIVDSHCLTFITVLGGCQFLSAAYSSTRF
jgi:hypothetical protein